MSVFRRAGLALLAVFWSLVATAAETQPVELCRRGGCENLSDRQPDANVPYWDRWKVCAGGDLSFTEDAHSGKYAACFRVAQRGAKNTFFTAGGGLPLAKGARYRVSFWAKGEGIKLDLSPGLSSEGSFLGTQWRNKPFQLGKEWRRFALDFKAENPLASKMALNFFAYAPDGAVVTIDDVSVVFDPKDNPGIVLERERPTLRLKVRVDVRDAAAQLFAGGKEVKLERGAGELTLEEGVITLALRAEAKGGRPGVRVTLPGHPETDGRWRVGSCSAPAVESHLVKGVKPEEGWELKSYDDAKWPMAEPGMNGFCWTPAQGGKAETALFRQTLLWNQAAAGPEPCVVPPIRQWGFPRGGFEVFPVALYSPLPYALDDYELVWEMPQGFTLLDMRNYVQRYINNNRPQRIVVEQAQRDGQPYVRYRLFHLGREAGSEKTQYSLLPVKMTTPPEGDKATFYFHRLARGNFTELERILPLKLLPPVKGGKLKRLILQQFNPLGISILSGEHLAAKVEADAQAGFTQLSLGWLEWGKEWTDYTEGYYRAALANGLKINISTLCANNFPLNYGREQGKNFPAYDQWLRTHPEAQARYYQGKAAWGSKPTLFSYCNQYVLEPESAEFWNLVRREYTQYKERFPGATMIWTDWEYQLLQPEIGDSQCFCERCKKAFRSFAKLPADLPLSDRDILDSHGKEWLAFRDDQGGRLQAKISDICHGLGMDYMVYTSGGSEEGFWKSVKGGVDVIFLGCPGNGPLDATFFQRHLDGIGRKLRELSGAKQVIGQRFIFDYDLKAGGWRNVPVLSHDGFVDPRTWKAQVVRAMVATGGGLDLDGCNTLVGGVRYYIGEATRMLAAFEDFVVDGERADGLAASYQLKYPNLLVLTRGKERLVLLFNDGEEPLKVSLRNLKLEPGQRARVFESGAELTDPAEMEVAVPPQDVVAVHVK